ncbi:conserved hypothetical protein [Hyphomicrobiales bacterium]|nr:conserved hypothetical protein [Hyphomicrobiales bacterium]CAH1663822.1 conserved hypothetical protein [Hyphomicrobiales bacterium]
MIAQELITIPPQTALQVFTTEDAITPYLAKVREHIDQFSGDISTIKGRKDIASMAYKVAQTKTYLEGVGKELADEQKQIPKKIDACRKRIRDTLDAWRDEVRAPLTKWEEAEEGRVNAHREAIACLEAYAKPASPETDAATLKGFLSVAQGVVIGPQCEEYEAAYAKAKETAVASLKTAIITRERYEAEQAELEVLRREAEERKQRDREEEIRREAAEQERLRVENAAKAEREAADLREQELKRQAEDAERRVAETETRLKREAEEARAAEEAETRKREADREHRRAINQKALDAFIAGGISREIAIQALMLIAQRAIPNVTIQY